MNFAPQFIPHLQRWELFVGTVYQDTDGSHRQGYGHGNVNNFPPYVDASSPPITEPQAMEILLGELNQVYVPQLMKLFEKAGFTPPNDYYFCGWLDCLYNRGYGTMTRSAAFDWLKRPEVRNFRVHAANALTLSHVDGFEPLDVSEDKTLPIDPSTGRPGKRVYEGLTGRRACDTALCLFERF